MTDSVPTLLARLGLLGRLPLPSQAAVAAACPEAAAAMEAWGAAWGERTTQELVEAAVRGGEWGPLEHLLATTPCPVPTTALRAAAESADRQVLEVILRLRPLQFSREDLSGALHRAARAGRVANLKTLRLAGCPLDDRAVKELLASGAPDVVHWTLAEAAPDARLTRDAVGFTESPSALKILAASLGCKKDHSLRLETLAAIEAVRRGDLSPLATHVFDAARLFEIAAECPESGDLAEEALSLLGGHTDVETYFMLHAAVEADARAERLLDLLHERAPSTGRVVRANFGRLLIAAARGSSDAFFWLVRRWHRVSDFGLVRVLETAAEHGNKEVLRWMWAAGYVSDRGLAAVEAGARRGHQADILRAATSRPRA